MYLETQSGFVPNWWQASLGRQGGDTGENSILVSVWLTMERALFLGQALPGDWLSSWVSRLLLKSVLEKPLAQVTGS